MTPRPLLTHGYADRLLSAVCRSQREPESAPPRSVTAPFGLGGGRQSVPVRHAGRSNDGVFHHLTAQRYSSPPALGQLAWSHWGPPPPYSQPPSLQNITQDSGPSTPGSLMRAGARQTPVAPRKRQDGDGDNLSFKSEALDVTNKSPTCSSRSAPHHGRGMTGSLPTRQRSRTLAGRSLEDILHSKTPMEESSSRSPVACEESSALSLYGRYKRPLLSDLGDGMRGSSAERPDDIPGDCSGVYYIPNVSDIISHGSSSARSFPSGRKLHLLQCGLEAERSTSPARCPTSRSPRPVSPVYAANHVLPSALRVGPEGASVPQVEPLRRPLLLFGSAAVRDSPSGLSSSTASPRSETSSCFSPPSCDRSPARLPPGAQYPRRHSARSSPQRARRSAAASSASASVSASSPCTPLHGRTFGGSESEQDVTNGNATSPVSTGRAGRRRQLVRYVSDDNGNRSAAAGGGGRRRRGRPVRSLSSGRCVGTGGTTGGPRRERYAQERARSEDLWAVSGQGRRGTQTWGVSRQRSEGSQRAETTKKALTMSQSQMNTSSPVQISETSVARIRRLSRAAPARIASVDDDLSVRIKRAHVSTFSRSEPSTPLRKHRVKNV